MKTRRKLLKTAAAAVIALPVRGQQHQHAQALVQMTQPYVPRVFSADRLAWVSRLVDIIIPRSDTPGASDAGVPAYIDRKLSGDDSLRDRFLEGMTLLDAAATNKYGRTFLKLTAERQVEMLTPIATQRTTRLGRFFKLAKDLTIDGYYTSKPGLTIELGWNANTYLAEFPGCTHPDHRA